MGIHMGSGYGSEFHLMRIMGRYRNEFNRHVEHVLGGKSVEWLDLIPKGDYDCSDKTKIQLPDAEYKGIDFLSDAEKARVWDDWTKFWPQSGNAPNWDAVGRIELNGTRTWVLVEAKAHTEELISNCAAKDPSKGTIQEAFNKTREAYGIQQSNDWTKQYYQTANRLAMAYFLNRICHIPTKLLFLYFCGDNNQGAECPETVERWKKSIKEQDNYLGLKPEHKAELGCHSLFWHVITGPLEADFR